MTHVRARRAAPSRAESRDRAATPSFSGPAPLPAAPATAVPGSPDRIAALAARAARGESLHHPDDAKPDLS